MNETTPFPPSPEPSGPRPAARPAPLYAGPRREAEPAQAGLVAELLRGWPIIAAVTALAVLGTYVYVLSTTRQYQATALLQIEAKGSVMTELKDLSNVLATHSGADTEIQLIESRSVLEKVVEAQQLLVSAAPEYLPIVGPMLAHRWEAGHATLAPPFLGLTGYAWGNEAIKVSRFDVPEGYARIPFRLVAATPGEFDLYTAEGALVLHGQVGKLATGEVPRRAGVGDPQKVQLLVDSLAGSPGQRFVLSRRTVTDALGQLLSRLEVTEQGQETGVIALRLTGEDPERLRRVLDDICERYLRQNVEQKSAEADKTLQFVQGQLPHLKAQLDRAERRLSNYQSKTGAVNFQMETQAVIDRAVEIERHLAELRLQRTELIQRYTAKHPQVVTLDSQIAELERAREGVNHQLKGLPDSELRSVQLARDVRVANDMYVLLLNKAQELKVVKSGTVGNARIVDHASVDPASPVWPKRNVLLLSGAMAGLLLGLLLAGLRRPRDRGVEDPDTLEDGFGLPVLATVEKSRLQKKVRRGRRRPKVASVLAERHPDDAAVESIRTLRTVLQSVSGPRSNVVLISGLQPRVGKSFVSTNLAAVIGAGGQRVLLIDGDLRRGDLHQLLARPRGLGLAAVASGNVDVREAILPTELPNVFLLPTGPLPRNPSELLLGRPFAAALEWASHEFDVVLLDAPPALAVTDAAVMGKHAGVTLLVLEWGVHPPREIRRGLSRFGQANVRVAGFVLNAIPPHAADYDRSYTYASP